MQFLKWLFRTTQRWSGFSFRWLFKKVKKKIFHSEWVMITHWIYPVFYTICFDLLPVKIHTKCSRTIILNEKFAFLIRDYHFYRLVNLKVVQACTVVLSDWERLPARTIKSAVTLLHRIAFGCKVPIMLFQVNNSQCITKKNLHKCLKAIPKWFWINNVDIFHTVCIDRYHCFEYFNKYLKHLETLDTMKSDA